MVEPTAQPGTDADRFWQFALAVYLPQEGRALFLRLQDEGGLDVPLALFCLWCGAETLCLSEPAMRQAIAFSAAWRRERVEPLRALRRTWKQVPGSLPAHLSEAARQRVAQAEQAVERLQMDHLVTLREGVSGGLGAAADNLALYCQLAPLSPDQGDLARLAHLSATAIARDQ